MTCPDWTLLLGHRSRRGDGEPAGWRDALAHLEVCAGCRRQAVALDSTLAFRALPAPEPRAGDIERMREAVRAVLRSGDAARRGRRSSVLRRGATAAALALAALALEPARAPRDAPAPRAEAVVARGTVLPARKAVPTTLAMPEVVPLVEGLDRPGARVYELRQGGLAVVMVVDESLDL